MSTATTRVHLDDVTFHREDGDSLVWAVSEDPLPQPGGGKREGALLVQVLVDGQMTVFHHDNMDRVMLERVIFDLEEILQNLDAMYPAEQSRGRCLSVSDAGRCWGLVGHSTRHDYPEIPAQHPQP